jgi:pimeloyl-ACP methyl ester carboxylesterase
MNRTRRLTTLVLAATLSASLAAGLVTACSNADAEPDKQPVARAATTSARGTVVDSTVIHRFSAGRTRQFLRNAGYPTTEAEHGIIAHRLVYRTVDPWGRPTQASGLVAFPNDGTVRLRQVFYAHGTTPTKASAPSVGTDDNYHQAGALSFAAAGYAVVAPDYLGLGVGPGRPAYLDGATEETASLDLLRAAQQFARGHGHRLGSGVRVVGFSQGAHAAVVVARALQEGSVQHGEGRHDLTLSALVPISGVYAFRDAELPGIRSGEVDPKMATLYLGYLLTSWGYLHGIYDSPDEVFQTPYSSFVEGLYDGTHPGIEVYQRMPSSPAELLTDEWLAQLEHPTGAFAAALAAYDQSCQGWVPEAPMLLMYTSGDREAVAANTSHCVADFAASGYAARTRDLVVSDHSASGAAGVVEAIRWLSLPVPGIS